MCSSYVVGAPVPRKHEAFDIWLEAVKRLDPPPKEIIVATEVPFPPSKDYTVVPFTPWIPNYLTKKGGGYGEKLLRIGEGREAVRQHFLDGECDWLFCIDSDIEVPPNAFKILLEKYQTTGHLVIQNLIPERDRHIGQVFFGTILTHREILKMVHFFSIAMDPDRWISEDWLFFNVLDLHTRLGGPHVPFTRGQLFKARHYIDRDHFVE